MLQLFHDFLYANPFVILSIILLTSYIFALSIHILTGEKKKLWIVTLLKGWVLMFAGILLIYFLLGCSTRFFPPIIWIPAIPIIFGAGIIFVAVTRTLFLKKK